MSNQNSNTIRTVGSFNDEVKLVNYLLKSGAIPESIKNEGQALSIIKLGRELGLEPMTALNNISLVKGKAYQSTDYLVANYVKRGGKYRIMKMTDRENHIKILDEWGTWLDFEYTIDDARAQGLIKSSDRFTSKYESMPKRMLFIRNIRQAILTVDPGASLGTIRDDESFVDDTPPISEPTETPPNELEATEGEEVEVDAVQGESGSEIEAKTSTAHQDEEKLLPWEESKPQKKKEKTFEETLREEEIKKLTAITSELGITQRSALEDIFKKYKTSDINQIPVREISDFTEKLTEDLTEHRRINSLSSEDFVAEIERKLDDCYSDDDLDQVIIKYEKFDFFTPGIRALITRKRSLVNKGKLI